MKTFKVIYVLAGVAGIVTAAIDLAQRLNSVYTFNPSPQDAICLLLVALWAGGLAVMP
jgi:hypothetical protein